MSKDIRSFFNIQRGAKPKTKPSQSPEKKNGKAVVIDDDDVVPESPDVRHRSKERKNTKKRRIIEDSSDEDIIEKKSSKKILKANTLEQKNGKSNVKEVSAADMFGSGPVKRTKTPKKTDKPLTPNIEADSTIHSDEDFEKTLLQLDEPIKDSINTNETPVCESDDINKLSKNYPSEISNTNNLSLYKIPKKPKSEVSEKKSPSTKESSTKNKESHKRNKESPKRNKESPKRNKESPKRNKESPKRNKESPTKNNELITKNKLSPTMKEKKRDYSEFLDMGNKTQSNVEEPQTSKNKKRKCDVSLNESVLSDEERFERKRHSAMLYKNYLNRSGPANPGSKEIPEGAHNCLKDLAFVLTGVLTSFERDEIVEAIQKYGGSVKSGVSKKVTHVLAGEDAGPAKIAKAEDLGLKIINEDGFLDLIKKQSGTFKNDHSENDVKEDKHTIEKESKIDKTKERAHIKQEKAEINEEKEYIKKEKAEIKKEKDILNKHKCLNDVVKLTKTEIEEAVPVKVIKVSSFYKKNDTEKDFQSSTSSLTDELMTTPSQSSKESKSSSSISSIDAASMMWVDKYKPRSLKQIIGQNGDASNVKKLSNWLMRWYVNRKEKLSKPSPWSKKDDGGYYKAALLSGPPGVGKSTSVALVCAELGYDVVELNASDTRSKTLIKEQVAELLTSTSLAGYVNGQAGRRAVTKKRVLVMDEVDGMAGNEDRGGLQELIGLIKLTSVPIVCMCNDRNSTKMRTLVNYCYDLKFSRPRVDQIKSAMMSVCFKEGLKIPPETLTQLIVSTDQDVRQTLHLLSVWAARGAGGGGCGGATKDVKLGPWEAIRKVFSSEEHKKMSLHDKCDLFFYDYNISPLFVQENYIQVAPDCPKEQVMRRMSAAADSISLGDLVEARVRGSGAWNLLPVQAVCSSVTPGHAIAGRMVGQLQFPAWLGKNSRATRLHRLAREIHAHTRLSASGSKSSIFLDYCWALRDAVVQPLVRERADGVPAALAVLQQYHLLREDLDSLAELALWPGRRDPMLLVDAKVKAAMTRAYNKQAAALPFAQAAARARAAGGGSGGEGGAEATPAEEEGAGGSGDDAESDSDPEHDALIKKKKRSAQSSQDSAKSESKGGKGKKSKGKG